MKLKNNYDETDPMSIEKYSKELINKTFETVLHDFFINDNSAFLEAREKFNNPYRKGSLGNLIEEYFFGYKPNNSPEPDFPKAGVELKVTPYEVTKTGKIRAGERLVLGMIPNNEPIPTSFEKSAAYNMLKLFLLVLYFRDKKIDRVQHPIRYAQLISIKSDALKNDLEIIKSDYEIIISKIKAGRAHELSEADTMYLGACTKGATAKKSCQPQYYNTEVKAKRRAFSLKQGYMTSLINDYIVKKAKTYDVIVHEPVSKETFEEIVINKIRAYKGFTEDELREEWNLADSKSKAIFSQIVLKILGVKTTNAEEFEKSNTQVKTVRVEENGRIKESMSFPAITFKDFVKEEWENSDVYKYFSETRFLFVVFKKYGDKYYLEDAMFWHMPLSELEQIGQNDWLQTQKVIQKGVIFTFKGNRVMNNIPGAKETTIFHLRPKANKAAYDLPKFKFAKGNIEKDTDTLPNGDKMTRQCFWLNNSYVKKQIEKI